MARWHDYQLTMIPFFRKIRYQLAQENQFFKYSRYAIGEILLVVVGILLALYINNWNEIEKSKSESNLLLIDLKQDLENDIKKFKSLKSEYNDWLLQIQYVLDSVLKGNTREITAHNQLMAGRLSMNYITINKVAFLNMFNTGRKLAFDNPELEREIKEYYQYAENTLIKLNFDNEQFHRQLMSYYGVGGINTLNRVINKRNLEYIDWTWLSEPSSQEYINLETAMLLYNLVIETNLREIRALEKRSDLLIHQIERREE